MQAHRNLIPKLGLAAVVAFFVAVWLAIGPNGSASGDPVEVLGLPGATVMFAAILLTFATMFIAVRRAYLAGSWPWLLAAIFFWPTCYLYTLVFNRGG